MVGIQVLTGNVVVDHIFFQGRESEPVNWGTEDSAQDLAAIPPWAAGSCKRGASTIPLAPCNMHHMAQPMESHCYSFLGTLVLLFLQLFLP